MEFLDLYNNDIFTNILDIYLMITVLMGMVLLMVFFLFAEEDQMVVLYVGSFTIVHVYGLVLRQLLLG